MLNDDPGVSWPTFRFTGTHPDTGEQIEYEAPLPIEALKGATARLRLCGGTAWEVCLDGQEVQIGDRCDAHPDCVSVKFPDGRVGFFSMQELEVTA